MKLKNENRKLNKKHLTYKSNKYKYDFQQYETVRSFVEGIYAGKINIDQAEMDQNILLNVFEEFNDKSRPRTTEDKKNR